MLLFDKILLAALSGNTRADGCMTSFAPWFYKTNEPLLRAVAVKIDNVMEILNEDFPNNLYLLENPPKCIPPFSFTFLDCFATDKFLKKKGRFGIHITTISTASGLENLWHQINAVPTINMQFQSIEEIKAKYAILFTFIEEHGNDIITRSPSAVFFLDTNGNRIEDSTVWFKTKRDLDDDYETRKAVLRLRAHTALFVFSLMNCKNIIMVKEDSPILEQKEHIKKTGVPLVTYRVLKIDQALIKTKGDSKKSENPITRALHLCRGHFAYYSDLNPLFGKHTGTFWRSQHIRGKKEKGVVIKDYEV